MKNSVSENLIFRNIIASSDHFVIFSLDSEYRYLVFNENHFQTMKRIWGCDIAVGKSMLDCIGDENDRQKAKKNFDQVLAGESLHIVEEYGDTKLERRFYDNIYSPIIDDNKNIVGLTVMLTDITEEVMLKRELKESNATKDKFLSIIGHDLKDPFNAIAGLTEILLMKHKIYDEDKRERMIQSVVDSTKNTYRILDNLLTWSQTQMGKIVKRSEELNLKTLLNETLFDLQEKANRKNIAISNNIAEHITVYADKNMISTIIRNLISNAIKFTHYDGTVTIQYNELNNDFLEISVQDTGVGMRKKKLEELFRIDEMVSTSGTDNEKGTGLGLILCKEFVEMHDGKIWVESEKNKGSTFYFTVPCK